MATRKALEESVIHTENGLRDYMRERTSIEITELISRVMEERIITKEELAHSIGRSVKYMTTVLEGKLSMTVKEISDIFYAMGVRLNIGTTMPVEKIEPKLVRMYENYKKSAKE